MVDILVKIFTMHVGHKHSQALLIIFLNLMFMLTFFAAWYNFYYCFAHETQ